MSCKFVVAVALAVSTIVAAEGLTCPTDSNCVCGGTLAIELQCEIGGRTVKISLLPDTYLIIRCGNAPTVDYDKLPKLSAKRVNTFKSVTFKDCPLPSTSFKDVLTNIGVSKTPSLIIQNTNNLSQFLDRKYFAGLQDLTKLLLSVDGVTKLPDNLFTDMRNLTWLNIRTNGVNLSEALFKPLERLETLEISHNYMTNISGNLFSHLSFLRKLSLWQSNVTRFSKDLFSGVDVLEELDLSSNGLNELPASIFNPLRKLKKLTLFSNKFSALPPNLFANNEKLDTVVIFNNDVQLPQLPRGLFSKLPNLKEVYVQRCELETIPLDVFADSPKITNISLAYNKIEVLPEAIFNDQINLLELDLSHNRITKLEPKLFSSLLRLEMLKLCHNNLQEISSSIFSSLLSLIHLDMERNNLKTITPYLFSNNKQRMSINLAYNQLKFERKILVNNSQVIVAISPFTLAYNLRLLNLSHNEFMITFNDWWLNGHENLDISYNNISRLWGTTMLSRDGLFERSALKRYTQKPLKQLWISNNPLICNCQTVNFITQLKIVGTGGADVNQLNCGYMQTSFCDDSEISLLFLIPFILTINVLATIAAIVHRKRIYNFTKSVLEFRNNKTPESVVSYADEDEEFTFKELIPGLKQKYSNINLTSTRESLKCTSKYLKGKNTRKCMDNVVKIVIFSPNYLTSAYSNISIRQIHEAMKIKNTIYVFADIGPENSVYAFLKEQRDPRNAVVWNESNFWNSLVEMIHETEINMARGMSFAKFGRKSSINMFDSTFSKKGPFSRLPDSPCISALDSFDHSQV